MLTSYAVTDAEGHVVWDIHAGAEVIAAHWGLAFLQSSAVDTGARHPFRNQIQRHEVPVAPQSFEDICCCRRDTRATMSTWARLCSVCMLGVQRRGLTSAFASALQRDGPWRPCAAELQSIMAGLDPQGSCGS